MPPSHSKLFFPLWCYPVHLNNPSLSGRQILFLITMHSPHMPFWPSFLYSSHTDLLFVPEHTKLVPAFKPLHLQFFLPGIPPPGLCWDMLPCSLNLRLAVTFPGEFSSCHPTEAAHSHLSHSCFHHIVSLLFIALINS